MPAKVKQEKLPDHLALCFIHLCRREIGIELIKLMLNHCQCNAGIEAMNQSFIEKSGHKISHHSDSGYIYIADMAEKYGCFYIAIAEIN